MCENTIWRVLRNQVSVVLQKNVLFSGTILENLRWGDEERQRGRVRPGLPAWPAPMNLSSSSRTGMIPILNREEPMCPADRSRGSVLPGPC